MLINSEVKRCVQSLEEKNPDVLFPFLNSEPVNFHIVYVILDITTFYVRSKIIIMPFFIILSNRIDPKTTKHSNFIFHIKAW